jgi:hypothetical protein
MRRDPCDKLRPFERRETAYLFRSIVVGCYLALSASFCVNAAFAQTAPAAGKTTQIPTIALAKGVPTTIDAADRILRARVRGAQPQTTPPQATLTAAPVRRVLAANVAGASAPICPTQSTQSVEIVTLAAALKCDPDLIFEYVYNNIEYEPLFGSNKGALGALLDQRGSDIDQANLFAALLSAAGFTPAQLNYQYGYITLTGAQASSWLGVKNDGPAIINLLANGGIPINSLNHRRWRRPGIGRNRPCVGPGTNWRNLVCF